MDFFDKMKDGISKGIDTIGAKSKELVETTKVQSQISDLGDKKKAALQELGTAAYALFQKGALQDAGLKSGCEAVGSLETQILAKQEELKQIRLKYQEQPEAEAAAPAAGATCACGAALAAEARFCPACGKKTA